MKTKDHRLLIRTDNFIDSIDEETKNVFFKEFGNIENIKDKAPSVFKAKNSTFIVSEEYSRIEIDTQVKLFETATNYAPWKLTSYQKCILCGKEVSDFIEVPLDKVTNYKQLSLEYINEVIQKASKKLRDHLIKNHE